MNECFGVALCGQAMTALLQIGAQLEVIVNLAVEDDMDGAVFVGDGLMTAGEIDDA